MTFPSDANDPAYVPLCCPVCGRTVGTLSASALRRVTPFLPMGYRDPSSAIRYAADTAVFRCVECRPV